MIMVAVASVLISAGKRRRVTKSPLTAPIAAPIARHTKIAIGNASLLPRANTGAEHEAQREDCADRQVDQTHEHDERLADRDKGKRGDLLTEKKQAIWKQERRDKRPSYR